MRIVSRTEGRPRGLHSGVLGFPSAPGTADLAVVLASGPAEEHEEMLLKARVPLSAALAR